MALPGDAFLCPKCELIVANPDTSGWPEREHDNSLIRAFLEPPEPSVVRRRPERPALPPEVAKFVTPQHREVSQPTVKTPFVADSTDIPVVVGALDLTLISMSPFEALVVSFMDGTSSVNAVRQAAGLSKPEIQAVLMVLIRKGVVVVLAPAVPDSPVTMEAAGGCRGAAAAPPGGARPGSDAAARRGAAPAGGPVATASRDGATQHAQAVSAQDGAAPSHRLLAGGGQPDDPARRHARGGPAVGRAPQVGLHGARGAGVAAA